MNTQLPTAGGSKVQGKYIKKMYWTWRFLFLFMILGKSLNFLEPPLTYSSTSQGSCSTQMGKYMLEGHEKYQASYKPDGISSSLLREFSIKIPDSVKRMSK